MIAVQKEKSSKRRNETSDETELKEENKKKEDSGETDSVRNAHVFRDIPRDILAQAISRIRIPDSRAANQAPADRSNGLSLSLSLSLSERPPAVCRENAYSMPRGSRRSVTSFRVAAVSIVFEFSETTCRGAVRAGTKRLGPPRLMRRSAGEPVYRVLPAKRAGPL